jgi:riboflavin synthase
MFTGIIEELGKVETVSASKISVLSSLSDIKAGDSVSVNGICLTATSVVTRGPKTLLSFDFTPETGERSNIRGFKAGLPVNLERAMRSASRLGGHIVSGHVESVSKIVSIKKLDDSYLFGFTMPDNLRNLIVPKGSVAIDGVSLTVATAGQGYFDVAVIPHTFKSTTLGIKKTGEIVNIESDFLAKYAANAVKNNNKGNALTEEFLKDNGFF